MSAVKRPPEDPGSDVPPAKKKILFEPLQVGPVSTLEEMDIKVLQFQHKKLKQVLNRLTESGIHSLSLNLCSF